MVFHENRLLADDSHKLSYLIFFENKKSLKEQMEMLKFVIPQYILLYTCVKRPFKDRQNKDLNEKW